MVLFLANEIRWICTQLDLCWWLLNNALHLQTADSSSPAAAMNNGSRLFGCGGLLKLVGRQIFVVDQLLKTRAGENVLSLLSAIIPFYVKDLLQRYYPLHLQEGRSTAGSYTRIRAVEQRFYDAIVVLATKKIEDQRKGLTILYLADQPSNTRIHGDEGQSKFITAWSCIWQHTMFVKSSDILLSLHKLCKDGSDGLVAVYYGLAGAPWVAGYARDFLGLSVCAFSDGTSIVPIHGDCRSAKVILRNLLEHARLWSSAGRQHWRFCTSYPTGNCGTCRMDHWRRKRQLLWPTC